MVFQLHRSGLAERTDFQFLGEEALNKELRDAIALANGTTGECELVASGRRSNRAPIIELDGGEFPSVVLVVAAGQLVQLFDEHRSALFSLNIRNYLGNTATNKSIIETLRQDPTKFYYYNNGIGCLAEKMEVTKDRIQVRGLQVINGAQTVRAIHKASKDKETAEAVKQALVLVRVTEAAGQYGATGKFRDSIVRYNNTQNVIKLSDFKSNDAIHEDLRNKFAQHRRDGKQVVYVSKRTDPREHRNAYVVPMEEFSKVVYSFLRDPVSFSAKTSFLFDESESGGYVHVFGDGTEVYTTMPAEAFKIRSAVWWMATEFEKKLKIDRANANDPLEKAAMERKWFILFIARLVLERSFKGSDYQTEVAKHYKGNWHLGSGPVGEWMSELYKISKEALVYRYTESAAAPDFVHRNWMRNPKTVENLTSYVKRAPLRELSRSSESTKA